MGTTAGPTSDSRDAVTCWRDRMRILLVEDQPKLGAHLVRGLGEDGHVVEHVKDGAITPTSSSVAIGVVDDGPGIPAGAGEAVLGPWREQVDRVSRNRDRLTIVTVIYNACAAR